MTQSNRQSTPRMPGNNSMKIAIGKPNDFKGTLKRLLRYLKPYRIRFIIVILLAVLSTSFAVSGPKFITGNAVNLIFEGMMSGGYIDYTRLGFIISVGVVIFFTSALANYLMQVVVVSVTQSVIYQLRKDVDAKLSKLPLKYFDQNPIGQIMSRVTNDVETINATLQQSIVELITSVITVFGFLFIMLSINVWMTMVTLTILPFSFMATKFIAKKSQQYFISSQRELGNLNGQVEEVFTGQQVVRSFGQEQAMLNDFDKMNEKLKNINVKASFMSGVIMPVVMFIGNIGYVINLTLGVGFMMYGHLQLGDIQAFVQYMRRFNMPIMQLGNIANIIQSAIAASERVFELLDEQEEQQDLEKTTQIENVKGEIEFKNVRFGYDPSRIIINDFSFIAKPGQTIAIVGPTGAGKTTLVNLLMRFYEINSGSIMIDDVDTKQMSRHDVRSLFGMVLQDTWLYSGTIMDNIRYSKLEATDEEVIDAAKAAHIDEFICSLPDGYETIIDQSASNLSSGQKQLITIARAILADPSLLILDEATSSVDTRTEVLIQNAMELLMNGRTSFVIAHRLSTIKNADVILVMNHGDIIEQGNHHELMQFNGFYANLYNSQFQEEM